MKVQSPLVWRESWYFFLFLFLKSFFGQGSELSDSWADSREVGCEYEFRALGAEADKDTNHSWGPRNPFSHPLHASQSDLWEVNNVFPRLSAAPPPPFSVCWKGEPDYKCQLGLGCADEEC